MMKMAISSIFRGLVATRHFLYDHQIIRQKTAPLPVVSIGNVVTGGAGKTQLALLLGELLSTNLRVAILSRGYKGGSEHAKEPLVVDPKVHDAKTCGDEPWLLANRLGSSLVIVNKNRLKSAHLAKSLGAELLLLDDGMQHRKLKRDYEIVVIDGKTALKNFLPKGVLRENLSRLKVANLIVFVGEPEEEIVQTVSKFNGAPQVVANIVPEGFFELSGKELGPISGKKVALFCGIGNPRRFVKTIEDLGGEVVATHFLKDHSKLSQKGLKNFASLALSQKAELFLCTEKDKVKLIPSSHFPLPVGWLKVKLEIIKNQAVWAHVVEELKQMGHV